MRITKASSSTVPLTVEENQAELQRLMAKMGMKKTFSELERTEFRCSAAWGGVLIARKIAVARSRASYGCSAEF
jgi:hypothetical protein